MGNVSISSIVKARADGGKWNERPTTRWYALIIGLEPRRSSIPGGHMKQRLQGRELQAMMGRDTSRAKGQAALQETHKLPELVLTMSSQKTKGHQERRWSYPKRSLMPSVRVLRASSAYDLEKKIKQAWPRKAPNRLTPQGDRLA
jgi:hypothetical protein